jgi:hypothetical protein
MNKLGRYQDDEQGQYNFSFSDNEGKHISVSFRAEPDYDLDVVFSEFKNFLIASGHDVDGDVGEIHTYDESDEDDDEPTVFAWTHEDGPMERTQFEPKDRLMQNQTQDKFSMDHLPNNGWPFGGLTSAPLPRLTTADFPGLKVTDISALSSQSYSEWMDLGNAPTMAPLTQEQIDLWKTPMPGTLGGAKIDFK